MDIYYIRYKTANTITLYVQAENKEIARSITLEILKLDATKSNSIMMGLSFFRHIDEIFDPYRNTRCYLHVGGVNDVVTQYHTREEKINLLLTQPNLT